MQCVKRKTIDLAIHDIEEYIKYLSKNCDLGAKRGAEHALELLNERLEEEEEEDAEEE